MAIKFNVFEIDKPGGPVALKKFYPRPVHSGEITNRRLLFGPGKRGALQLEDLTLKKKQ